jgi:hypothetical protein
LIFGGIIFGIILGATVVTAIIADPIGTIETIGSIFGTVVNVVQVIGGFV